MTEQLWCCIRKDHKGEDNFDWQSLSWRRTDSIKKCVGTGDITWVEYKKWGWRCVKVNMTLEIIVK